MQEESGTQGRRRGLALQGQAQGSGRPAGRARLVCQTLGRRVRERQGEAGRGRRKTKSHCTLNKPG